MAIGISYAAIDEEVTAMAIQGAATGGVIIISCVFTVAFYYSVNWLNKIHDFEHLVNPVKRRSLKPIGISMKVKPARMGHHRYPRVTDSAGLDQTDSARHVSDPQMCNDQLDVPFIVMGSSADDATDGNNEDAVYLLDHIGGDMMKPFSTKKLQQMPRPLILLLFLSAVLMLMGLMARKVNVLWLRFY